MKYSLSLCSHVDTIMQSQVTLANLFSTLLLQGKRLS